MGIESDREEITLEEIRDKFEATKGVRVWGVDAAGNPVTVLVSSDGKVNVENLAAVGSMGWLGEVGSIRGGTVKVATIEEVVSLRGGTVKVATVDWLGEVGSIQGGTVDITDRPARELGHVDATVVGVDEIISLRSGTVKATVQGGWLTSIEGATVDVEDRAARELGHVDATVKGGTVDWLGELGSIQGGTVKVATIDEVVSLRGGTVKLAGGTIGGGFLDSIYGATVGEVISLRGGTVGVPEVVSLRGGTVKVATVDWLGQVGSIQGGTVSVPEVVSLRSGTVKATVAGGWLTSLEGATVDVKDRSARELGHVDATVKGGTVDWLGELGSIQGGTVSVPTVDEVVSLRGGTVKVATVDELVSLRGGTVKVATVDWLAEVGSIQGGTVALGAGTQSIGKLGGGWLDSLTGATVSGGTIDEVVSLRGGTVSVPTVDEVVSLRGGTVKVATVDWLGEVGSIQGGTVALAAGTQSIGKLGGGWLDSVTGATVSGGTLDELVSLRGGTVKVATVEYLGELGSLMGGTVKATVQGGWLTSITKATVIIDQESTPHSTTLYVSGDATIWTPGAGKKCRIKYIQFGNYGATLTKVGLKNATAGGVSAATAHYRSALAKEGGQINMNLIGCNWLGGTNFNVYANISATSDVSICVVGDEVT